MSAVTIWFSDRIFCDFYTRLGMRYGHAVWHILSFFSSYTACVLIAYFYVKMEDNKIPCRISYWPNRNLRVLGVPYVEVSDKRKKRSN